MRGPNLYATTVPYSIDVPKALAIASFEYAYFMVHVGSLVSVLVDGQSLDPVEIMLCLEIFCVLKATDAVCPKLVPVA